VKRSRVSLLSVLLASLFVVSEAAAVSFNFEVISPFNSDPGDLALLDLTVDVTDAGSGDVFFKFLNESLVDSSIAQIYFDESGELSGGAVDSSSGQVSFTIGTGGPGPNDLPGGNNVGFNATQALNAKASAPVSPNGVGVSEMLTLLYTGTFADVIKGLSSGELRIGIHVQSIGDEGTSDSFVSVVPEPSTALLFLLGISGIALLRRRAA